VSIVGGELRLDEAAFFDAGLLLVGLVAVDAGGFFIIHILVWEERIERPKIRSLDVDIRRAGKLLPTFHESQNFCRRDGLALREEPP